MKKLLYRVWVYILIAGCCGLLSCAEIVPLLEELDIEGISTTLPPVQESPAYRQVLDKLESLTPGEAIAVRMGTDKERYNLGETIEARFAANQDCYMSLMRIATNGDITFLAPSQRFSESKIEGERVYSSGASEQPVSEENAAYDLGKSPIATSPDGVETLNLFCSTEPFELFEPDFDMEAEYTIASDDDERLLALLERLEQPEQREWSGTSITVIIGSGLKPTAAPSQMKVKKGFTAAPDAPMSLAPGSATKVPRKFGALPPVGATGTTGKFFPPLGTTGTSGKFFPHWGQPAPPEKQRRRIAHNDF